MSGTNPDKASGVDRRTSLRTSTRLSNSHDDDDDSYALAAMAISDGFRPPDAALNHGFNAPDPPEPISPDSWIQPRPSSVTKGHRPRESLTLRHDGDQPPIHASNENAPARMSSVSGTPRSSAAFETRDEPMPGPSHPYEMYPQNVRLARTASLATTSTAPISERSYNGPRGPTHPYGMYPQTMVPEAEEPQPAESAIPVGFPGTVDNYQRRLGPEGEEAADLIGPDGHMEQLPPYTRYPEEAYQRKALGIPTPQSQPQPQPPQPTPTPPQNIAQNGQNVPQSMQAIPAGAGGIGLATRNPEFASTDELAVANSPLSRQSVRSFASEASHHEINTAAMSVVNEKEGKKGWRAVARKRVWGVVPCWAIALAVLVLILMGVVVGAVLGTILGSKLQESTSSEKSPFNYDYTPISTMPPDLPPLAEGTYEMPLMLQRSPDTCFDDTTQAGAWNCNILNADLSLNVSPRPGEPETSSYSFKFQYDDARTLDKNIYSYGMQPPSTSNPLRLRLVEDTLEPDRGPAWSFQTLYNKTVIIPEEYLSARNADDLSMSSGSRRIRREDFMFGGDIHRKGIAKPGEKPWVCYWESTLLETFIYATQNNSFERVNTASASSTSSVASSTTTLSPTDVINKLEGELKNQRLHDGRHDFEDDESWTKVPGSTPTTSSSATPTKDYFDRPTPTEYSQVYPRVIKVMERRIPGFASVDPWCRQFEILGDGSVQPVLDPNGHEIHVTIKETEEELEPEITESGSSSSEYMSDCGCLWWLT